ncbi:hypothetical protein MLD38_013369 [Melastoma candidum]|uniref:Uncharacterized protein n=1 Tax=Melastoma candidum TaxID=119954 RepID=A0ACB9R9G7_9MYRT|nr:hypothetical protein MLD38_013369 [Melastoma candidum]
MVLFKLDALHPTCLLICFCDLNLPSFFTMSATGTHFFRLDCSVLVGHPRGLGSSRVACRFIPSACHQATPFCCFVHSLYVFMGVIGGLDLGGNILQGKKVRRIETCTNYRSYASRVRKLCQRRLPHLAEQAISDMRSEGLIPDCSVYSAVLLCYARNGLLDRASEVWDEILYSSYVPDRQVIFELVRSYVAAGQFGKVKDILDQLSSRGLKWLPEVYAEAISCFGNEGQRQLMEEMHQESLSLGFPVHSTTSDALIRFYSEFGSLEEMENAYGLLRHNRHLIQEQAIRAMALSYIRRGKFYRLTEFLRDVSLTRKDLGNLLWNLLLLSYAAEFKMKNLQREFINMVEAGFDPDITTFNIRLTAFSRMSMFWDIHLSVEHMNQENVTPDLVTYGCLVDSYLDRRLGRNLRFALDKMRLDDPPVIMTDPLMFEASGKGDFHSSSEAFMEFSSDQDWSYRKLVAVYLRKHYRRDNIFWNY